MMLFSLMLEREREKEREKGGRATFNPFNVAVNLN